MKEKKTTPKEVEKKIPVTTKAKETPKFDPNLPERKQREFR